MLELTRPFDEHAIGQLDRLLNVPLRRGDKLGGITAAHVQTDIVAQPAVLALDRRRAVGDAHIGHVIQGHRLQRSERRCRMRARCDGDAPRHGKLPQRPVRSVAGPAHLQPQRTDREAVIELTHDPAAGRRRHQQVDVRDRDPLFRGAAGIGNHGEIALPADRVGDDIGRSRNTAQHFGDLFGRTHDGIEIPAEDADADFRIHAGRQHVDAVLDRLRPDIRPAGHLHRQIHLTRRLVQRLCIMRPEPQPRGDVAGQLPHDRIVARMGIDHGKRRGRRHADMLAVVMNRLGAGRIPRGQDLLPRASQCVVEDRLTREQFAADDLHPRSRCALPQFGIPSRDVTRPAPLRLRVQQRLQFLFERNGVDTQQAAQAVA